MTTDHFHNFAPADAVQYDVGDLPPRVVAKIQVDDDGCWVWTAYRNPSGYGQGKINGKFRLAHRAVYELLVGPIPSGLVTDHLCRNHACVNPAHLEPVTQSENMRRGLHGYAIRTTCRAGLHDITDAANIYTHPDGVKRRCRACQRASAARCRALEAIVTEGNRP